MLDLLPNPERAARLLSACQYRPARQSRWVLGSGGHAKRNEFKVGASTRIAYDGTESIDTPSSYAPVSQRLLSETGIDMDRFYDCYDQQLYDRRSIRIVPVRA